MQKGTSWFHLVMIMINISSYSVWMHVLDFSQTFLQLCPSMNLTIAALSMSLINLPQASDAYFVGISGYHNHDSETEERIRETKWKYVLMSGPRPDSLRLH